MPSKDSITSPALKRLAQRAGITRSQGSLSSALRDFIQSTLSDIVPKAIIYMRHAGRKTVQCADLEAALEQVNIELAAGLNKNAKKTQSLKSYNSRGKAVDKSASEPKKEEPEKPKKAHRYRPGVVSQREVRYQQNHSDNLAIPQTNFRRLTRALVGPTKDAEGNDQSLRFAEGVFLLLQLVIETLVIGVCRHALACSKHAGRKTVTVEDLQLAILIRSTRF